MQKENLKLLIWYITILLYQYYSQCNLAIKCKIKRIFLFVLGQVILALQN